MDNFITLFLTLVFCHFLADYSLQTEYMAISKNRWREGASKDWFWALFSHSSVHALVVYAITHSMCLAVLELVLHFIIDDRRCKNDYSYSTDQLLHISCKLVYALILIH